MMKNQNTNLNLKMILKKDIFHTKKDSKNISKNKLLLEETSRKNLKHEIFNEKSKEKTKKPKIKNYHQKIYNQNKKIQNNQTMRNKKDINENFNLNNNKSIK